MFFMNAMLWKMSTDGHAGMHQLSVDVPWLSYTFIIYVESPSTISIALDDQGPLTEKHSFGIHF